jgi:hypothetical protein
MVAAAVSLVLRFRRARGDTRQQIKVMLASAVAVARCELEGGALWVRNVPGLESSVTLRLRLWPRVFQAHGEELATTVSFTLPLLSCPLTPVAGTLLRGAEEPGLVVRLDATCGQDVRRLRWRVNGARADIRRVVKSEEGVYVLLHTSGTAEEQVTITAARADVDRTIIASATGRTLPLPQPRVALELPGYGTVDFVPTNRAALVHVSGGSEPGRFVPLPVEGVYDVTSAGGANAIRGVASAGGFTALRFGYRLPSLPAELATTDLAIVTERVQRAVREASVPAPIAESAYGDQPLVEFLCAADAGADERVPPSRPYRIRYAMRDTCRIVIHVERLSPEQGDQEVVLQVSVRKPDGSERAGLRLEQRMVLRPGSDVRIIPLKGGLAQFDHVQVSVAHVADETRYVLSATNRSGLPAAQWMAIVEGGKLRLNATAAIPAGLYRVSAPSGQLTLNFGLLSRLTRLNQEGKESLLGLEVGVMGLGLVPQSSDIVFPPTLAIVGGLGLRVALGGGAAVGVQAWAAREFRGDVTRRDAGTSDNRVPASHWSFIFGPSITIGDVGVNL